MDNNKIDMYSFRELQKAKKKNIEGEENRLALIGNCATQFFADAIEGLGKLSGINLSVYDADYNQIDAQLLDVRSGVYSFNPDEILICLCTEKLYEDFLALDMEGRTRFAEDYINKINRYWYLIEERSHARIIQLNFTEIDDKVLGQYSCKVESSFTFQIRKLNFLLQELALENGKVYIVDMLSLQIRLGLSGIFNAPLYYSAKMTFAISALPEIAAAVIDVISAMRGTLIKCVILDLDNTLWGGVIGDDGIAGIEIGELGKGHVFTNLQRWLKQLKEYGIILAVCSKNDEAIAKEPFEKHEEMVLRLSDISLFVANWDDKATNIHMIQESLNIGMESILFIDDNPFERNLVREKMPDIKVPELPEDPCLWLGFLQSQNYFETASYSIDSSNRTKQYQAEFQRRKSENSFETIDDYLQSLEMVGDYKAFEPIRYPRIAQLTQRSNQFNLRTVRYTEDEIKSIAEDERYISLYFTLKDKFGDHGLVSVVIMEKRQETLFIDTWLMSCRVLKRGMEEFVINAVVQIANESGYNIILAEYIPTSKNMMVRDIYETMGFEKIESGIYSVDTRSYTFRRTYIKKEK